MSRIKSMHIAVTAMLIAATGVVAQPNSPSVIEELEQKLNSSSFAEREAVSRSLLNDIEVSDAELLELCMTTTSPEVRRRALAIHRSRFFASPRAAIGVTFREQGRLPMIERVHDPFPASFDGSLQPGDIIVGVAGMRLNSMPTLAVSELRPLVFSHNPYETVILTVYRPQNPEAPEKVIAEMGGGIPNPDFSLAECPDGFETVETAVQLGEWAMLDTKEPMPTMDRVRAWDALLARKNFNPTELGMSVRDDSPKRNVSLHGRVVQSLDIRFPFMTRAAFFPNEENPAGFRNQAVIAKQLRNVAIQQVRINPGAMPGTRAPGQGVVVETVRTTDGTNTSPQDLATARTAREIASLQSRILELSAIATEPGTPAAERRIAQDTIEDLRNRLNELRDGLKPDETE
ncbi:MAG: hypothetical protein ACIAQF_13880 [Phycisphaerales bacterium JB065]